MAAGLNTGGFAQANVMPDAGLLDPRLLAANYGNIAQGVGQGLQLVNNFAGMQQLALDRADANALREARLRAQRAQLEIEPQLLNNRLALSNADVIARQSTPIELAEGSTISRTPEGDVLQIDTFTQVDPVTGARSTVGKSGRPLALAEDLAAKKALSDYRADTAANTAEKNKLAAQLNEARIKSLQQNADTARLRAEAYKNSVASANGNVLTPKVVYDRREAQHLADINSVLGLPDIDAVNNFRSTSEGRGIVDAINSARIQRFPVRFNDEQQAYLNSFREGLATQAVTDMANQPPAAGSAPTAAAQTLPQASPVRQALSPQDQQAADWAAANPNDPRAAAIRQRLGL